MSVPRQRTRAEATAAAGAQLATALEVFDSLPARAAAERAHRPGGPSVDDLEARILILRGEAPSRTSA